MNHAGQEAGNDGPPKTFLSCGIRTNQLSFPPTGRSLCVVHLVYLVCFVHLVDLVQPNKQDKPNKRDKLDEANQRVIQGICMLSEARP